MVPKNIRFLFCATLTFALFLVSCTKGNKPAPIQPPIESPQVSYLEHTISFSGETLAEIAAWYTGRALNWRVIRDANPKIRPDRLRLGQVILIPRNLITNEKPFTRKVSKKTSRLSESAPEAKATPAPKESSAAATESPTPSPTAAPLATVTPTVESVSAPEATIPKANSKDVEREKLLDELLK